MPTGDEPSSVVLLVEGREVALGRLCHGDPLVVVETVARLHLAAKRRGWSLVVRGADPELRCFFDAVGLVELLDDD